MDLGSGHGFGREAQRARDASLPLAHRVGALTSCIEFARPIGFNATWSYLEAATGLSRREPEFVAQAIELLHLERTKHLALEQHYAGLRRGQKAAGLRFPPRCDASPRSPARWHGDERKGARHALKFSRHASNELAGHPLGLLAHSAATDALHGDEPGDLEALERALSWARRQTHVVGWESDPEEYRVAADVQRLLGQVYLLTRGAPAVGAPWHFHAPGA